MYMKVFPHGQGGGHAPTHYLVRQDYHGRDKHPPVVLRGNVETTRQLIDSLETKWRFTAGVLSWHPDDKITEEQEEKLMDDFEAVAFAGLEADQRNILWVRHSHAEHHELHFVIPRMELHSGKAFNPCPPGWQKHFDVFRDLHNMREQWARPDDPARARLFTPEQADLKRARLLRWGKKLKQDERSAAKEAINEYIRTGIEQGQITNRQDIVKALQDAGLKLNRAGKDYITVQDPDSGEKLRLKGQIYAEHWKYTGLPRREDEAEDRAKQADRRADDARAIQRLEQELAGIIQGRLEYNRKRYPPRAYDLGKELFQTLPDSTPLLENQHGADGVSPANNHSHRQPWNGDLLQIQTQELTGRSAQPYCQSRQLEKSNEPLARKDLVAGTVQVGERTLHHSSHGNENRPNIVASGQERSHTPNHYGQVELSHDKNRTSFDQIPCQDGAGIDRHTKQTDGRTTASQKGTTRPQGTSDTFAKSAAHTEQAIAKFEQRLRELGALIRQVEQYFNRKLSKKRVAEHSFVHRAFFKP